MSCEQIPSTPSAATVVRTLRDGFWDRTEVVRLPDGTLRVRKASKGVGSPGPWGVSTLRREIRYLRGLKGDVAGYFPALLAAWDDGQALGYEMSYIEGVTDAGTLAQRGAVAQKQADAFQDRLSEVAFGLVHEPVAPEESLAQHVRQVIADALAQLERCGEFETLVNACSISINGDPMAGPRVAFRRLLERGSVLASIDRAPGVRLHGDLFLENVLVPQQASDAAWPTQLVLVDPVSVAGVFAGHPLFDLVKYESYATGQLLAMRSEKVDTAGFAPSCGGRYVCRVRRGDPAIRPFEQVDWHTRFRAAYVHKYGEVDWQAYRLLEAYFCLVMAVCTGGIQRRARVLKGTRALNAAAGFAALR